MSSADYNNFSSGSAACSYGSLGDYSANYNIVGGGPAFQGKVTSGSYIVPSFSSISYDSLTAAAPSCSGYSDIMAAYGADAGSCQTTYRTSICGGSNMLPGPTEPPTMPPTEAPTESPIAAQMRRQMAMRR
jgi:hypothetical protein